MERGIDQKIGVQKWCQVIICILFEFSSPILTYPIEHSKAAPFSSETYNCRTKYRESIKCRTHEWGFTPRICFSLCVAVWFFSVASKMLGPPHVRQGRTWKLTKLNVCPVGRGTTAPLPVWRPPYRVHWGSIRTQTMRPHVVLVRQEPIVTSLMLHHQSHVRMERTVQGELQGAWIALLVTGEHLL